MLGFDRTVDEVEGARALNQSKPNENLQHILTYPQKDRITHWMVQPKSITWKHRPDAGASRRMDEGRFTL